MKVRPPPEACGSSRSVEPIMNVIRHNARLSSLSHRCRALHELRHPTSDPAAPPPRVRHRFHAATLSFALTGGPTIRWISTRGERRPSRHVQHGVQILNTTMSLGVRGLKADTAVYNRRSERPTRTMPVPLTGLNRATRSRSAPPRRRFHNFKDGLAHHTVNCTTTRRG